VLDCLFISNKRSQLREEEKMKTRISAIAASSVLILAILACNAPTSQVSNDPQSNLPLTITAQALIIQNSTNQVMQVSQSMNTPTPTPTSTPGVPMVSVSSSTNCRSGPSTYYDLIYTLNAGQTAEVVGKYSGGNYWVIKTPGGGGNCWLWGQYATILGDVGNLPEVIPPPAPPIAVSADTAVPGVIKIKPKHPTAVPTYYYDPLPIATAVPTYHYDPLPIGP
jgi:uncharacterized protein YraI